MNEIDSVMGNYSIGFNMLSLEPQPLLILFAFSVGALGSEQALGEP